MSRLSVVVAALCAGLVPEALSCAESRPADATVVPRARPAAGLVVSGTVAIPYGADASSPGFSPAGDEREALGPVSIEVLEGGTIRIADSLRRALFDVRVDAAWRAASVAPAGPMPERLEPGAGGVPTAARAARTSAEDGEIVFAEGGAERRVAIRTGGPLAAIRLLGVDRAGRAFALVERYRELGRPAVDREVIVVERSGALIARTALPGIAAVRPVSDLFLTPDGALYRLSADADAVRITRYEVRP